MHRVLFNFFKLKPKDLCFATEDTKFAFTDKTNIITFKCLDPNFEFDGDSYWFFDNEQKEFYVYDDDLSYISLHLMARKYA